MADDRVSITLDRQIFMAQRRGGVSRYFVELAREFAQHPDLGVDLHIPVRWSPNEHLQEWDPEGYRLAGTRPDRGPVRSALNRGLRLAGRRAPHDWRDFDLIHHTYYSPEIIEKTPGARRVVTVHDMIHELYPHLPGAAEQSARKRRAVAAADAIICVSQSTRNDLTRLWGSWLDVPIHVIHHGVGAEFTPSGPSYRPGYEYLLYVGTRSGYKSFGNVLEALSLAGHDLEEAHLVCVGGGAVNAEERQLIRDNGLDGRVHQTSVTKGDLPAYYRGANAFVFPSMYEGFGMPILEAMATGCPSVAADTPALREVAGSGATYFRRSDAADLARLLLMLRSSPGVRASLCAVGLAMAAQHTWGLTARRTAAVYRTLLPRH